MDTASVVWPSLMNRSPDAALARATATAINPPPPGRAAVRAGHILDWPARVIGQRVTLSSWVFM